MKITRRILIVIGSLIALLLIVALFVKKDYAIEREITIHKSRPEVFNYVKQLKNGDDYNKWVMTDPAMKKEFAGKDGTVGFVYKWDSENNNVGKGEQEIIGISDEKQVDMEIRFKKPFENTAHAYLITEDAPANGTKVKWGMKCSAPYPLNLMNLFVPDMLGDDIDMSLVTLKGVLEKS